MSKTIKQALEYVYETLTRTDLEAKDIYLAQTLQRMSINLLELDLDLDYVIQPEDFHLYYKP